MALRFCELENLRLNETMHTRPRSISEEELLLAHVLHRDRAWVIAHPETTLTKQQQRDFATMLRRRNAGTPIAYLTGSKEFYGRPFIVNRTVLIPRPETERLIEVVLGLVPLRRHRTIADIGTGSGCIAVTLAAERPRCSLIASDTSFQALRVAKKNAARHGVAQRIRFLQGSLLIPFITQGIRPDVVVANLPYLTPGEYSLVRHEPRSALVSGKHGLLHYQVFFQQLRRTEWHMPIVLEVDPRRVKNVKAIAGRSLPRTRIHTQKDLAGRSRVLVLLPSYSSDSDYSTGTRPSGHSGSRRPTSILG